MTPSGRARAMRPAVALSLMALLLLPGCVSDEEPAVPAAGAAVEDGPANAAGPARAADPTTATADGGPRREFDVSWDGQLTPSPGISGQGTGHVRVGAGREDLLTDAFEGRLERASLTLTWTDVAPDSRLELKVLVGSEGAGWTEVANAAGTSPLSFEWDGEKEGSNETRRVRFVLESADRGTPPLEARAPSQATFTLEGVLVVDGAWTARHVS